MQGGCWMREEQHELIHSHTSGRPALAVRTARNGQQECARRRSGKPRKPLMQCITLSFLRMGHVSRAADARESLRSLIHGSGGLLGWPSVSKYVRIRIFGKLRVHAVTGAEVMRDLVKLLAEEHGVAVEDLVFSGISKLPSTAESVARPGLSWLLAAITTRKVCVLNRVLAHPWQPIGSGNVFSILLLSRRRIFGKVHRLKIFYDGNVWLSQSSFEGWTAFP